MPESNTVVSTQIHLLVLLVLLAVWNLDIFPHGSSLPGDTVEGVERSRGRCALSGVCEHQAVGKLYYIISWHYGSGSLVDRQSASVSNVDVDVQHVSTNNNIGTRHTCLITFVTTLAALEVRNKQSQTTVTYRYAISAVGDCAAQVSLW